MNEIDSLREQVRERYAAATAVTSGGQASCCCVDGTGTAYEIEVGEGFGGALYTDGDRDQLPAAAVAASLGVSPSRFECSPQAVVSESPTWSPRIG